MKMAITVVKTYRMARIPKLLHLTAASGCGNHHMSIDLFPQLILV